MQSVMKAGLAWLRSLISLFFPGQRAVALENLALRHQLLVPNPTNIQTATDRPGQTLLGCFISALGRLEAVSADRSTQDSRGLAAETISPLLDEALKIQRWTAWCSC